MAAVDEGGKDEESGQRAFSEWADRGTKKRRELRRAAVAQHVYHATLADFAGNGHGTIRGPEVDGLTVRDCVLVTDRDEAEGDVTPACVQE
jgi:hypothetical protein